MGRIIYEYEQGGWNEWHIVYNDGTSGWLADAQLEYELSWAIAASVAFARSRCKSRQGQEFQWNGKAFQVTSRTHAHYKGVQGELPFRVLGQIGSDVRRSEELRRRLRDDRLQRESAAAIRRARPWSSTNCI